MSSSTNTPRRARANSLISLMCELEGIPVPGPDAYTTEPPEPLTEEETGWVKKLIEERERSQGTSNDQASLQQADPSSQGFVCPTCKKEFKTRQTLRQHTKDVHIGTKCFWPGCSTEFGNEDDLSRHLRLHNTDLPDGHKKCNWPGCTKSYKWTEGVFRHVRNHQIRARDASAAPTS